MKKQRGGLLQRMLVVLLTAALVTGTTWYAPASALAQESAGGETAADRKPEGETATRRVDRKKGVRSVESPSDAENETFTITYKTNADVEMGTITYNVGEEKDLPTEEEISSNFSSFMSRAKQKGSVKFPKNGIIWYEDKEFSEPAAFPDGQAGENYTLYCKLTVFLISAGNVINTAKNGSYADINKKTLFMAVSGYTVAGRNDYDKGTKAIFEKMNDDGQWEEVPDEYYKSSDRWQDVWPNMIFFRRVTDSGTYRLKDVCYTATDRSGEVLYYVYAEDTPQDEYTVNITPVELSVEGVSALDRNCDGTDTVQLSGGTLQGVLFNDDVSFSLGDGTIADQTAGSGKPVTTDIILTGEDAENYTLKQPEGITVTISHAADDTGWHYDGARHWKVCPCGEELDSENHDFGSWETVEEMGEKRRECRICHYVDTEILPPGSVSSDVEPGPNAPETSFSTPTAELEDILLTEEEKQQVQKSVDAKIVLTVEDAGNSVDDSDKNSIQQALNGFTVGEYLNIGLHKQVGEVVTDIHQTERKIKIVITVPDSLENSDSDSTRTFSIIRVHDGEAEPLPDLDSSADTITIETDSFSIYAIVYKDSTNGGSESGNTGGSNDSGEEGSSLTTSAMQDTSGEWVRAADGVRWWFCNPDGTWPIGWKQLVWNGRSDWYYFDKDGYMVIGWLIDPATGLKYYLHPVSDGMQGYMYAGWKKIEKMVPFQRSA